jgi:hypothetical protein
MINSAWEQQHQARWMVPNAARWLRPDAVRWRMPQPKRKQATPHREAKYPPDQLRVPAGSPDGGQWTDGGSGSAQTFEMAGTIIPVCIPVGISLFNVGGYKVFR